MEVRLRFAPSPTGVLHVGGVRTAIYNFLYAKKMRGKFLLRIEDTDVERSREEFIDVILGGLRWLKIEWDEEIIFQSKRLEIYRKYAEKLIREKKAYYCFCLEEELEEERKILRLEKKPTKYSRKCLKRSEVEIKKLLSENREKAIRFLVPEGETRFVDLIHGEIVFKNEEIEDFIILRSDGTPTYNFACVIDDKDMGITHVIRGDDHISNTPKQILLYKAFGWKIPEFAHLPMILGPDRKKLSKRHGATSVIEFKEEGFLPEALFNFLALLGWSPGGDVEIISREEMIEKFDIRDCRKSASIFDRQKLLWMNSEYIKRKDINELVELSLEFLRKEKWWKREYEKDLDFLKKVIELTRERAKVLRDIPYLIDYFYKDDFGYDIEAVERYFADPKVFEGLEEVKGEFETLEVWNEEEIEKVVRKVADNLGEKHAFLIHPLRIALTGRKVGPSLFKLMELIGKERCIERIRRIIKELWGYIPGKTEFKKI
ncbi:MAG: glutamate--tRNA ligase [Candidatus Hydrothermales bacterium]